MIYLLMGRRKRGKSTLAYYLSRQPACPRRVVFDPRGLFRRDGAFVATTYSTLQQGMEALADGEISELVYTPIDPLDLAFRALTTEIRYWLLHHTDRPLAVVVDELSFVDSMDTDFQWALKTCNDKAMYFFLTCHRPADVPTDVRSISDYWYLFHTTQEHDLDVVRKRCGPVVADAVTKLAGSQVIRWDDGSATWTLFDRPADWFEPLKEIRRVPRLATIDSSSGAGA